MRYLPLTDADRRDMLRTVGVPDIDALFADVPPAARLDGPIPGLSHHMPEMLVERHLGALAAKNMTASGGPFFVGAGAYKHHVPASVDHIIQRGEFLTSYTPYQPEIAQGTLQVLFEFQTQVARLTGMEVANASMYDGSTAMTEAVFMARRVTRRKVARVSSGVHPHYVNVLKTLTRFTDDAVVTRLPDFTPDDDLAELAAAVDGDTSCVVVQNPNVFGHVADLAPLGERVSRRRRAADRRRHRGGQPRPRPLARRDGGRHRRRRGPVDRQRPQLRRAVSRPVRLPREARPDDARPAVRRDGRRRRPPRLRPDAQHPRAAHPPREGDVEHLHEFGPVRPRLQRPPQPARRERACRKLAALNHARAVQLADRLERIPGVEVVTRAFFNEFTLRLPVEARPVVRKLADRGVLGGVSLGRLYPGVAALDRGLVVAVTETATDADMDAFEDALDEVLA